MTFEEVSATSLARCREILGYGGMRGVFADGFLGGFCGYRPQRLERTRHRCEIGPFFVTYDLQGSGAATAMMIGVVEEAKTAGVSQIELFVDTENPRAIAFYERHGFHRITTFKDSVRIDGQSRSDHFMVLKF
ncbi:GNAT family N-acetyltransferase [Roseobacter sp. A03A-229]